MTFEDQLEKLFSLKEKGALTEEEYQSRKSSILQEMNRSGAEAEGSDADKSAVSGDDARRMDWRNTALTDLSKNDLISALEEMLTILSRVWERLPEHSELLTQLKKEKEKLEKIPDSYPFWITLVSVLLGIALSVPISFKLEASTGVHSLAGAVAIFFASFFVIRSFLKGFASQEKKDKMRNWYFNKYVAPLVEKSNTFKQELEELGGEDFKRAKSLLPEQYTNRKAIKSFISYLKTGRADSLKEAINLYEEEERNERLLEVQQFAAYASARSAMEANVAKINAAKAAEKAAKAQEKAVHDKEMREFFERNRR